MGIGNLVRDVSVQGFSSQPWYLQFVEANLMSTTALLVYEYSITLDFEVELIWKKPNTSIIKWLFLFIRYFALVSQLSTQILSQRVSANVPNYCMGIYVWRLFSCQTVLTAVELVLIHRVHALYQNRTILIGLLCSLGAEVLALAIDCVVYLHRLHFSPLCLTNLPPDPVLIYGAIALSLQGAIFFFTVRKHVVAGRAGLNQTPILTLLIRDGAAAFAVIFALQIGTMVYLTKAGGFAFMQYWLLSLSSCVGCRLIINLQRLGMREDREPFTIELTTQFSASQTASSML